MHPKNPRPASPSSRRDNASPLLTDPTASPPQHDRRVGVTAAGWVALLLLSVSLALNVSGAILWSILTALTAVHEAGHALAARHFRFPIRAVVVGVGPKLVEVIAADTTMTLRALPIAGWVSTELGENQSHHVHRRCMMLAAAGPIFSLLAALLLNLGTLIAIDGVQGFTPSAVRWGLHQTVEQAAAMPTSLVQAVRGGREGEDSADVSQDATDPGTPTPDLDEENGSAVESDRTLVSVVGMVPVVSANVERHGYVYVLTLAAAISASVGVLNLIPAFGLDGSIIVSAFLGGIRVRSPRVGLVLGATFTVVSGALLVGLALIVVTTIAGDVAALV